MAYLGKAQVQAKLKPPKKRLTQTVPYCPLLFGSEADPNLWAKKADNLNPQELSLVQLLLRSVFSLKTRDFKTVQDAIPVLQSRLEALCGQSATIGTPPQSKNKGMNSGADQILKGDGDKQAAYPAETLASMRVYTKYLIDYFEASLQFAQGKFSECIKRLNSLASPKAVTQGINSQGISGPFQDFFAENGLGCVYLKMNKPALALLSFNKAMARLRQLSDESIKEIHKENKRVEAICVGSKTSRVLYNMALSQLKLGNYEVAWKLFERASSDNVANFTFWYRFGVCGFNWFLKECELRSFKVGFEIT
jgi:tetratricopeptide (TPR) repeat protein